MNKYTKGTVVLVEFPFTNLMETKKRPALVIAELDGEDLILCQITSTHRQDDYIVPLSQSDCKGGFLKENSLIRTNKIFTVDSAIINREICKINDDKIKAVEDKLVEIFVKR